MLNQLLEKLALLIADSAALAPLLCIAAGLLTSLLPCSLSSIPLVIGYVSAGGTKSTKRAALLSLLFALGQALTFTTLGVLAALAGKMLSANLKLYYLFVAILLVLMALQTWGVVNLIPASYLVSKNTRRGGLGAVAAGILAGAFSSPCATPVLIALLALVARDQILRSALLLFCFSLGHGILTVLVGTATALTKKLTQTSAYGAFSRFLQILLGALMLIFALYMFYQAF